MRRFKCAGWMTAAAVLFCTGVQASDTPGERFGAAFQVETTEGAPVDPAIASNAQGGFVVAWQSQATDPASIRVRRFTAFGEPFSDEHDVGAGVDPAVAMNATGGFVVVFNRADELRFALFTGDAELVREGVVDSEASAEILHPTVGMSADRNFVVAYTKTLGANEVVIAREFDANGNQVDDVVAPFSGAGCESPVVAMSTTGRFVVACVVAHDQTRSVQAQAYDASGAPVGPMITANALDATDLTGLRAAMDGTGRFVLVWSLGHTQINARFFDPNGAALGPETTVVADPVKGVNTGGVSMSATGATVITWDNRGQGASQTTGSDVFERRYDKNGVAVETRKVNADTRPHLHQLSPSVALDADGDFVVVWQDGDTAQESHILGQRFVGPENVNLALDLTDSPDPANGGEQITYLFKVSNLHAVQEPPAGASNGVATVIAAIGGASEVEVNATMPAGSGTFVQGGSADWGPCEFTAATSMLHCVYQQILGPGEETTVSVRRAAATSGSVATATGNVDAYQFDANQANNTDSETTALSGNPATVQFAVADSSVDEDAGTKHVTVTLSKVQTQPVTVAFAATNASTATSPADYTLSPSPLTIPAGQLSADIIVTVVDDTVSEPPETVVLQLSSPSAGTQLGTPSRHTLTINDDEPAQVRFHQAAESVNEGGGPVQIQVDLSVPQDEDVTVNYAVAGTATLTSDYTIAPTTGSVTIPAGEQHATITITPVDDTADELDETVQLTLTSATNAELGANKTNTLTIVDNEAATVPQMQFQSASATAGEADGDVVVTVVLSQPTTVPVTAQFSISGSADSQDFTLVAPESGIVSFAAGSSTATITIHIRDDGLFEPAETLVLTLSNPNGATLGTQTTFTLTILDNDAGGIGSNTITIDSAAPGKQVRFTTSQGKFSALSVVDAPNNPPGGLDYPLGFFAYVISDVAPNTILTLTVDVPQGSSITDWIQCLENSCFRMTKDTTPDPGQANIGTDQIVVVIQDNGQGDNDPRPGFVSAKVAPARMPEDEGGSMTWLLLLPLAGAAALRRRKAF